MFMYPIMIKLYFFGLLMTIIFSMDL